MIFVVFDPSPLTLWINCCFVFIFAVLLPILVFFILYFQEIQTGSAIFFFKMMLPALLDF